MNLTQLTSRAQTIRQQPVTAQTRGDLEALRKEAAASGVGAAFDKQLAALFKDVYGGQPPALSTTSMGDVAKNAGAGGTKGGAVISFHGMRDPASIEKTVASRVPAMKTTVATPIPLEVQFKPLTAAQKREARSTLETQLRTVPVSVDGAKTNLLDKLKGAGLDSERLLDVLAMVQVGYERVENGTGNKPPGYQLTNWKHTRLEVDRVLDAGMRGGLTAKEMETALYASFLSDAVKTPGNFIVHNVHGAQAAVHVLARLVPPPPADMIEDVVKATLEHQIGPPGFMGNAAMRKALNDAGVEKPLVDAIAAKVAKPFENVSPDDKTQVHFTGDEKAALAKAGIFAWTVPHEGSRHYKASRAVIDGDSLVNYACPDGWAKLAELHGPDQPAFLQEPRFIDALLSEQPQHASAYKSFLDARSVVSETSLGLYDGGRQRTKTAIDKVMHELGEWVKQQADVPRTADGKVPYLDGALDYKDEAQVAFARLLRAEGARLLRVEERES